MFDEDEDPNPHLVLTDEELETVRRIGGLAGYLAVLKDRVKAISGTNAVMRGEAKRSE